MRSAISYIKTVDGNENIQALKEKLFRAAPDLEHAIITDAQTIEAQAATIERLADALKALVDYIRDAADDHDCINWYAVNTDEGAAARALLAEIRGKDA